MSRKTKARKLPTAAVIPSSPSQPAGAPPRSDWTESLVRYKQQLLLALALAGVIWLVFGAVTSFSFLTLDDREVVTSNRIVTTGLRAENLSFVFWDKAAGNWIPLTWMSHMLDTQWEGGDPAAHHETNLWLHGLSALLLFALLVSLTGATARSLAAAGFFALHPLRAQSVAWVAERQGLLAAFFSFLTLVAWARARRAPSVLASGLAIAAFAAAVMSSPAALVLPLVMLLLEYWPLESADWSWKDKAPFAAIAAGALVLWLVRFSGAARPADPAAAAGGWAVEASFAHALAKTVWPVNLTPLMTPATGTDRLLGVAALAALLAAAFLLGRRHRFILTGLLWFVLALAAAVTLSEFTRHSYADRFTYFAHAGLGIAIAWTGHTLLGSRARYAALALALPFTWLCWVQLSYWKDDAALFGRALALDPSSGSAHAMAGGAYLAGGETQKAVDALRKAVSLDSKSAPTRLQLAQALFLSEKNDEALAEIDKAIEADPKLGDAQHSRGLVLRALNRQEEARAAFQKALDLGVAASQRQDALLNLGLIEVKLGRDTDALKYFQLALDREPTFYLARKNLAFIYARQEKWADAKREFQALYAARNDDDDVKKALQNIERRLQR